MNAIFSQLSTEWIHAASSLIMLGLGGVGTLLFFYYRRHLDRADAAAKGRDDKLSSHDERLRNHDIQIRDVRAAIEGPRAKLGLGSYPYTE